MVVRGRWFAIADGRFPTGEPTADVSLCPLEVSVSTWSVGAVGDCTAASSGAKARRAWFETKVLPSNLAWVSPRCRAQLTGPNLKALLYNVGSVMLTDYAGPIKKNLRTR